MEINKVAFAGSCSKIENKPKNKLPEFAFIGRSNVGKSSLINMLCSGAEKISKGKELARTSASPGKTVTINHFIVDGKWYLVDLPGYGYAKTSLFQRRELARMTAEYINLSKELVILFVLLDSRHSLQDIDLQFIISLGKAAVPLAFVFTKADKLSVNKLDMAIAGLKGELLEYWEELPPYFVTSAHNSMGREEILNFIEKALKP